MLRKPIVYGNVATPLPKTLGSSHTHTWRLFLRSPNNEVKSRRGSRDREKQDAKKGRGSDGGGPKV